MLVCVHVLVKKEGHDCDVNRWVILVATMKRRCHAWVALHSLAYVTWPRMHLCVCVCVVGGQAEKYECAFCSAEFSILSAFTSAKRRERGREWEKDNSCPSFLSRAYGSSLNSHPAVTGVQRAWDCQTETHTHTQLKNITHTKWHHWAELSLEGCRLAELLQDVVNAVSSDNYLSSLSSSRQSGKKEAIVWRLGRGSWSVYCLGVTGV